jgi:hypothetical protein
METCSGGVASLARANEHTVQETSKSLAETFMVPLQLSSL